jgi:hypothetical protein
VAAKFDAEREPVCGVTLIAPATKVRPQADKLEMARIMRIDAPLKRLISSGGTNWRLFPGPETSVSIWRNGSATVHERQPPGSGSR